MNNSVVTKFIAIPLFFAAILNELLLFLARRVGTDQNYNPSLTYVHMKIFLGVQISHLIYIYIIQLNATALNV